jgi:signal transduction histidine kinase
MRAMVRTFLTAPFSGRTLREGTYLVAGFAIALVSLPLLAAALFAGGLLAVTVVGIPLLAATVVACRGVGIAERWLQSELLGTPLAPPPPFRLRPSLLGGLRSAFTDLTGWRAMAYIVVSFPLKVVGTYAVAMTWLVGLGCLTHPLWWRVGDGQVDADGVVHQSSMQFGDVYIDTWPRALLVALGGLVIVLLAPWPMRALVWLQSRLAGALVGRGQLTERVDELERTRAHAVDDSATTLRRIERDLHDGTQARLVALAMQLDMARESLVDLDDPSASGARDLLDTAHRNATEAITELRDVTRRIHPPVLDRGLDAALATLAARSPVPTTLRTDVPQRPSPAVETIAYFCVAELLTNVARHASAHHASVDVVLDPSEPSGSSASSGSSLRVVVVDDGHGGARAREGGGLSGLRDRVRTIDGEMFVQSPDGGPTRVEIVLPVGS